MGPLRAAGEKGTDWVLLHVRIAVSKSCLDGFFVGMKQL